MKGLVRTSLNPMHDKGFDSARQEVWLFQRYEEGEPCYKWVKDVYDKFGHSWDWDSIKRDDKGRFKMTPSGVGDSQQPNVVWRGCGGSIKLKSLTKLGAHNV